MKIQLKLFPDRGRGQAASTIAEVVVSTAIVATLFVSLCGGMNMGFAVTRLGREDLRATQIMLERMETIRLYNWNQINGQNNFSIPTNFTTSYYPPGLTNASAGITYTGTLAISSVDLGASYNGAMRKVKVSLNWQSGHQMRSRSMSTLVGSNGIQNYVYY